MNDGTGPGQDDQGYPDPTAPSWATPEATQEIPTEPTRTVPVEPPIAPPSPYAPPPAAPAGPPPSGPAPTGGEPWAGGHPASGAVEPPPSQWGAPAPYGQPAQTAYGQSPYGPSPYGSPFATYGQQPYVAPRQNSSALVLTIASAVGCLLCCLWFAPSLVFGIVALSRQSTDPAGSARITRYGWISVGVMLVLGVLIGVAFIAWAVSTGVESTPQIDYGI